MNHDVDARLGEIGARTLVVHGDADRMVRAENGRLLADGIRGARLALWPGAGHLYFTDEPAADRDVLAFLSEPSSPGPSSPGSR